MVNVKKWLRLCDRLSREIVIKYVWRRIRVWQGWILEWNGKWQRKNSYFFISFIVVAVAHKLLECACLSYWCEGFLEYLTWLIPYKHPKARKNGENDWMPGNCCAIFMFLSSKSCRPWPFVNNMIRIWISIFSGEMRLRFVAWNLGYMSGSYISFPDKL